MLALRDNLLTYLPLELLRRSGPPSLTYLDLAYNRIEELPVEAILREADPPALATLLLEGNPLRRPPAEALLEGCAEEEEDRQLVTSFAQVDARLRRYYQVERGIDVLGEKETEDEGKGEKIAESKRRVQQTACDEGSMRALPSGDDEDDASYNVSSLLLFSIYI